MLDSPYLTAREAAAYMRVSVPTLERWRANGVGPRFTRGGARILYHRADLDSWLTSRLVPLPRRLVRPEWGS